MFDKEELTKREEYYNNQIRKKVIIKKAVDGLKCACFVVAVLSASVPFVQGVEITKVINDTNKVNEYYTTGQIDKAKEKLASMSRYVKDEEEKSAFNEMDYSEKLSYIEKLLEKWSKEESLLLPAGTLGIMASVILSNLADEIDKKQDMDIDALIYEMYLDEKCSSKIKKNLKKKDIKEIEQRMENNPDYDKIKAKKNIAERSFDDDKQVVYNDYELGFKNGQYDFYSRCNYGSGNIYNKAMFYFEKRLSADKINKKLIEVSYKKGYYRSAGIYVAEKLAMGEELNEEENEIMNNMDNLSLKNILHLNRYSATEVKNRKDYWYGYMQGFKNEVNSTYSSIDFDLSGLSEDVKKTIDEALDINSYKAAFYRGICDGMSDLAKRAKRMSLQKEDNTL